ncbi:MAG: DUF1499 domain-containing protein [Pseudanabaena sp.]|nr:MAG: DUF1499 domain-containing protein [Pseudanabaena sp.]
MSKFVAIAASFYLFTVAFFGFAPTASAQSLTSSLNSAIAKPMAIFSFSGTRPSNLGLTADGKLLSCPDSPNCVSSQDTDAEHQIAPLTFTGDPAEAIANLKAVISKMPRAKIITAEGNYIYAEFTSAFMGYVDDVEFYLNTENGVIDVRSASRLGKSDLGVNRDRIETIRQMFA